MAQIRFPGRGATRAAALVLLAGCAGAAADPGEDPGRTTRMSVAELTAAGDAPTRIIRVRAGAVVVRHTVPSATRLRGTVLEGVDPENRDVRYEWERDGTYTVEMSGRYRHSVLGVVIGDPRLRLRSTLTYTPFRADG